MLFVVEPTSEGLPDVGDHADRELVGWGRSGRVERWGALAVKRLPVGPDPELARELLDTWSALARARCSSLLVPYALAMGQDGLAVVMALAPGGSLAERPGAELATWLPAVAEALDAAHAQGVAHGDLKATDVLFGPAGTWVSDFGLAAALARPLASSPRPSPREDLRALARLCLAGDASSPLVHLGPKGAEALRQAAWGGDQDGPGTAGELAAAVLAGGGEARRVIAPRVPVPSPRRSAIRRARSPLAVVAAVGLLAGAGAGLAGAGRAPGGHCPARAQLAGPLDGGACGATYWPGRAEATLYFGSGPPRVLHLGLPGDQVVVGDWTCSGRRDPALYRPNQGLVLYFPGWAPGLGAYARAWARPRGRAVVRRLSRPGGPRCDYVAVVNP